MIVLRVVVLPAPLRPTRQTTSRAPTSSDTPRRTWLVCEGDLRLPRERGCHVEELLVALRQVSGRRVALVAEAEQLGDFERAFLHLVVPRQRREQAGPAPDSHHDGGLQRLEDREVW